MFFRIRNVDLQKMEDDIQANIHNFYRKDGVNYRSFHWRVTETREKGDWSLKRVSLGMFRMPKEDEWFVNTSRIMDVDSTDNESLTRAETVGRQQVDEIFRFLRKYVPGCENARLKSVADHIGIRESRHIQGDYRLTVDDLLSSKVPEDSILIASNSVDVHGRFGPTSNEYVPISGRYYGVPYRSLLPKGVEQLLIAGRCISADSTAAALAIKQGCTVRALDTAVLREELIKNGACL